MDITRTNKYIFWDQIKDQWRDGEQKEVIDMLMNTSTANILDVIITIMQRYQSSIEVYNKQSTAPHYLQTISEYDLCMAIMKSLQIRLSIRDNTPTGNKSE